ncbi:hypothetical protein HZ994_15300 [Akkermansiaceae bacterium]|nr:hypothetical protein HZ994_15300 [Akkermansiaceae bacterium]
MDRQIFDHFRDVTKMVKDLESMVTFEGDIEAFSKKKRPGEAGRQAGNAIPGGEWQFTPLRTAAKAFLGFLRDLRWDPFREATELIP